MATQINNTADKSILAEITEAIAAHPHATGLTTAAIAAAVSEFYYGNAWLTTVGVAVASFLTGEIISRIIARSAEIQAAAAAGKAAVENLAAAGEAARRAEARAAAMEQELAVAKDLLAVTLGEATELRKEFAAERAEAGELRKEFAAEARAAGELRKEFAAEARAAAEFRAVIMAAKAKADEPAPAETAETPVAEKPKKVAKAA